MTYCHLRTSNLVHCLILRFSLLVFSRDFSLESNLSCLTKVNEANGKKIKTNKERYTHISLQLMN